MGCVLYPINVNALGELTTLETSILNHTVVIDFPIGELEPTASREELSYGRNEPTTGSIKKRVAIIAAQMEIEAQKSYLSLPTYWDACVKYAADISNTGQPEFIRNMIQHTASWNGRKLTGCLELTLPEPKYVRNPSTGGASFEPLVAHAAHVLSRQLGLKSLRYNGGYKLSIPAKSETLVVVEDLTEGKLEPRSAQRMLNYVKGNFKTSKLQVIWLRVYNTKNEAGALTQFLSELDGAQVLMMSDIPDTPKVARVSNASGYRAPRQPVSARVLNTGGFREMRELTDEEFKAGGFYFKLERSTPVDVPAGFGAPQHVLRRLQDVMGKSLNVYGAPKSMWKKFAGEQWINFYDYAKKWVEEQKFNLSVLQERNYALDAMKGDDLFKLLVLDLGDIGSNSPLFDYIMEATQLDQEKVQDAVKVERLLYAMGIHQYANENTLPDPIRAEWAALSAKVSADYPLLPILAYHMDGNSDITLDKVTNYVILCDTAAVMTESLAVAA